MKPTKTYSLVLRLPLRICAFVVFGLLGVTALILTAPPTTFSTPGSKDETNCPRDITDVWPDHLDAKACSTAFCESEYDSGAVNPAGPYYSYFQTDIEAYGRANAALAYTTYYQEYVDRVRPYPWPNCPALRGTTDTPSPTIPVSLPSTGVSLP